jgi:putative endonuclease
MQAHRERRGSAFVSKYGVTRLVWFEEYSLYTEAIQLETSLKRWKRDWKLALIEKTNPNWDDLLENWNA